FVGSPSSSRTKRAPGTAMLVIESNYGIAAQNLYIAQKSETFAKTEEGRSLCGTETLNSDRAIGEILAPAALCHHFPRTAPGRTGRFPFRHMMRQVWPV